MDRRHTHEVKRLLRSAALLCAWPLALGAGEPAQPTAFSHKLHAGDYHLDCLFCHSGARRSTVAGIPSVQFCMGCHKTIAITKPEIARLRGYWEKKTPIPWAKVVKEPDFVFFNHFPHVNKGIKCQECHGPIETMVQVRLDHSLNMDRCVACHRQNNAPMDCYTCHR
jgi:hypothetical protein